MPPRPDDPAQEPDGDPDAERAGTDERTDADDDDEHEDSLVDGMRGSGVGVEDPNIVGDAAPGVVDDQVQADQPPQV